MTIDINSFFGFLALSTYIATLIPSNIGKVFPLTKKWQLNKLLAKRRRCLRLTAFSLFFSHAIISFCKYDLNLLSLETYKSYYTGIISLTIFFLLAITSNQCSRRKLTQKKWKMLHQLTYAAMFLLLCHILIMMQDRWSIISFVALFLIITISLIFSIRLIIDCRKIIIKSPN